MEKINKIKIILLLIVIFGFTAFNIKIMPVRKELTELELIKIAGMDIIDEGKYKVEETILRVPIEEKSSGSSSGTNGGGSSSSQKAKIFSTKGVSFSDTIRTIQTYVDKTIAGSHIKALILGEDLCKGDMVTNLDFGFRDYELRLNANIYIAKNHSAKDFINKVSVNDYSIDEKIQSMEKNNEAKSVSHDTSITDLMAILANKNACGLVPTLEITSEAKNDEDESDNIQKFQTSSLDKQKGTEEYFDFGGYGVVNNRKLIGYLSRRNSITCNLMKNQLEGSNINIDLGDNNLVSFGVFTSKTGYSFNFQGDKLDEVIIKNSIKVNYEELKTQEDISSNEKTEELEEKISKQIISEIEDIIKKMKDYNCDFVGIEDFFKTKHPYKYENMRDNWTQQLLNAKFVVKCDAKILRTYDVLQIK